MKKAKETLSEQHRYLMEVTDKVDTLPEETRQQIMTIVGGDPNKDPVLSLGIIADLMDQTIRSTGLRRAIADLFGQDISPEGSRELLLYMVLLIVKPTPKELRAIQTKIKEDSVIIENQVEDYDEDEDEDDN